jgi:hypothetical protein
MGVYLTGVTSWAYIPIGVYLMGIHLMGMYLIGVYLTGRASQGCVPHWRAPHENLQIPYLPNGGRFVEI